MTRALTVEAPATSANLGPGFDALGLALDLRMSVRPVEEGPERVIVHGEGARDLPTGAENRIWQALAAYCAEAGVSAPAVSVEAENRIPLERGLGSSAAAAVAGLVLGRALTGAGGGDDELIRLAAELEGHADNAAAALLGGLVLCAEGRCVRLEPAERLRPVICVPGARQSTEQARGLLPAQVPLAQAAANGARSAWVVAALCGLAPLVPEVMTDVLHEPPRLAAMPATGALVAALRAEGIAACLSGAGPSVLAVLPRADTAALEAISAHAAAAEGAWEVWPLGWDRSGARVAADDAAGGLGALPAPTEDVGGGGGRVG